MVVVLSHMALRGARCCPSVARLGRPLGSEQSLLVVRLRGLAEDYCDRRGAPSSRSRKTSLLADFSEQVSRSIVGTEISLPDILSSYALSADRTIFSKTVAHFDPLPFLGVFSAACYLEPRLLDLRTLPEEVRPYVQEVRAPLQRGTTTDVLAYLRQWDAAGRLLLEHPRHASGTEQGSLFPVYKDENTDRIVFNRVPRNRVEFHLPGYARFTVGGHDLLEIDVQKGARLRFFTDDLADCYPAMDASVERGRSNALSFTAPLQAFAGTRAHRQFLRRCAKEGKEPPRRARPCHQGLPMGDLNAADWCAEAHTRLLRASGSYPEERALQNGRPAPRGGAVEALVLDDHLGVAVDDPGSSPGPNEKLLYESFAGAGRGYAASGWNAAPAKARRGVEGGVFLGAEIMPGSMLLGSERYRRQELARASWALALSRRATPALMRRLLATWVHALLYRRPLLALLDSIYLEVEAQAGDNRVFSLTARSCLVLARLAALAPAMCSDMAADYAPEMFASDASPYGLGACRTEVQRPLARELWRYREKRGAYTRLYHEWARVLNLAGVDEHGGDMEVDAFGTAPSPMRILVETWDFVELCSGPNAPLSTAMAAQGMRVGPRIDICRSAFWDLRNLRVVEWVLFLAERRRVWLWHSGVPYTTFGLTRNPFERSKARPWGQAGRAEASPAIRDGNWFLQIVLSLIFVLQRVGFGRLVHEHPDSALSWFVPAWGRLATHGGLKFKTFCACAYEAPFRKATRLALLRAPFLEPLAKPCRCSGPHAERPQGSGTTRAAQYLKPWCREYAELARAARKLDPTLLGQAEADELSSERRGAYEALWLNDWVRSARWRVSHSAEDHATQHINVKEVRAALREQARLGRKYPDCKVLGLLDSRVAIGACAKGRSASWQLNAELTAAVPNTLAYGTYPGYLFGPTRLQPADASSRGRAAAPLPSSTRLAWLDPVLRGDTEAFDEAAALPKQSRSASEWARLIVRLLVGHTSNSIIVRVTRPSNSILSQITPKAASQRRRTSPKKGPFDATLGYPGEGPRRSNAHLRPDVDLRQHRVLTPVVEARRATLRAELSLFVYSAGYPSLDHFLAAPIEHIDRLTADWGQLLWRTGRSILDYSEGINGLVDRRLNLRGNMRHAWEVAHVWRALMPAGNRTPLPESAFLAILALALAWGWFDVAVLFGAGFLGLLRPHELRTLTAADLLTPIRLLASGGPMFVVIQKPKMRRLGPRRSYVRIDEPGFVEFVDAVLPWLPASGPIFRGTYEHLRVLFRILCEELNLPTTGETPLTLGSFRPGGATWLYRRTDSPDLVRFRGRWASPRMLEIYIQEVGAASMVPALPAHALARLQRLAALAPTALAQAAAVLQCPPPPRSPP